MPRPDSRIAVMSLMDAGDETPSVPQTVLELSCDSLWTEGLAVQRDVTRRDGMGMGWEGKGQVEAIERQTGMEVMARWQWTCGLRWCGWRRESASSHYCRAVPLGRDGFGSLWAVVGFGAVAVDTDRT